MRVLPRAALEPLLSLAEKHLKRLGLKTLALAGGVAANGYLRGRAESLARKNGFKLFLPEKSYVRTTEQWSLRRGISCLLKKANPSPTPQHPNPFGETQRGQTVETLKHF